MSSHTTALTEELARDYANYAKIDWSTQMKSFNDAVEDVMMRLDEFQSLISMVQAESAVCMGEQIPKIMEMRQEVTNLGKRINALEQVIVIVNGNLCSLEAAVDNAEAALGVPDTLSTILNSLPFFKKSSEPTVPSRLTAQQQHEIPEIFSTDNFFDSK